MHTDKTWVKRVRPGYEQVLAPYPNIRIIGPSAVALLMDGSVIRAADLEDQLPLLILNKSECTKKGIEALLNSGFYRRKFCNIDSFNHSVEADIHTRALGKKAAQIHWEQEYFNVFSGSDKDYYYEFNAYKRKKDKAASLGRLYDSCLALVDWDDMLKSTRHILGPLSQESSATAAAKEQKFLAALKGLQKTLSLISPDTLEAANLHGIDIMAAPPNSDPGANIENGVITLPLKLFFSHSTIEEELTHYVDNLLGFTARKAWLDAIEHDFYRGNEKDSQGFMDLINAVNNKGNIFDPTQYSKPDRPIEILPDLRYADRHFETLCRSIGARARHARNQWDEARAPGAKVGLAEKRHYQQEWETLSFHVENLRALHYDKAAVTQHYFPKTWELVKSYDQQLASFAAQHRKKREAAPQTQAAVPNPWLTELASAAENGTAFAEKHSVPVEAKRLHR